ncbi:unnamed protein product [Symbiodinium sp. CCMP2456]|nr:unnamed protein product [Symbiodinium sp. CCMP2456]
MSSFPDGAGQSHAWNYVLYLLRSIERLADITSYCHPVRLLGEGLECKDSDLLLLAQGHELWSTSFVDAGSPSWPRDEIVPYIHDVLHWAAATVICNRRLFTCRRQAVARTVKKGMGATALALRLHDRFPAAWAAERQSLRNAFGKLKRSLLAHAVSERDRPRLLKAKAPEEPVSAQQESYKHLALRVPRALEASQALQVQQATATAAMLEFEVTDTAEHIDASTLHEGRSATLHSPSSGQGLFIISDQH